MVTTAVIQARMGSMRLPGKTLMKIKGKPILARVVDMAKKRPFINDLIVATTHLDIDNPIELFCIKNNIRCFRGSENNVLNRFVSATEHLDDMDQIVRITADNILNRFEVSNDLYNIHVENENDYTCIKNLSHVVFEIIKLNAIRKIEKEVDLTTYDKEHVTAYFRRNKHKYKVLEINPKHYGLDQSLDKYLTIDTQIDLERLKVLANNFDIEQDLNFREIYNWISEYTKH